MNIIIKVVSGIVLVCSFALPFECLAGEMDLLLKKIARDARSNKSGAQLKGVEIERGAAMVPCIMKSLSPNETVSIIRAAGGRANAVAGGIVSAHVPLSELRRIASHYTVIFAEAASPLSSKMDSARNASQVDVVQDGSALGVSYDGRHVVVGVVDDGLDWGHPDFSNSEGLTRIQYIKQTSSDGEAIECTKGSLVSEDCEIEDGGQGTYHGTHVTGIAAGSDSTYMGVAPAADIMFVFNSAEDPNTSGTSSNSFSTTVLEDVSKIFEKADELDKAAVVNLSMGTSLGAHDGTSLLEQGLSELAQAKPGRIIVNAAGNEQAGPSAFDDSLRDLVGNYVGGIHASINSPAGTSRGYRLAIWDGFGAAFSYYDGTFVDLWLDADMKDKCSVAVFAYTNGRSTPDFTFPELRSTNQVAFATADVPFSSDTVESVTASNENIEVSIDVQSQDARNSKPHATILLSPTTRGAATDLESLWYDVVIRSTSDAACTGHMWLFFDYVGYHDFLKNIATGEFDVASSEQGQGYALADGDSSYTATIPSTARGVISAGSFMPPKPVGASSSQWTGNNDSTYNQGDVDAPGGSGSTTNDLSNFSSLGPTADGRTKPDVVAPGEPIVAAKALDASLSSAIGVGDNHVKEEGTSMSSPHVAGIVALLLQRNNTLGVDAVRAALTSGAITEGMTSRTSDPANSYGAGKVNAAAVLASVGEDTSAYHGTGDLEDSWGCSLAKSKTEKNFGASLLLVALALALIAVFKSLSSERTR